MPKIIHLRENCIGCNGCVLNDKKHWQIDDEDAKSTLVGAQKKGKVFVLDIEEDDLQNAKDAADVCPVDVIKIEEK